MNEFKFPEIVRRKVCRDCHITLGNNYYSVPYEYVGKIVDVDRSNKLIKISHEGKQITVHTKGESTGEFFTNKSHYPKYKRYNDAEYKSRYEFSMQNIGSNAHKLFQILIEKDPHRWNRTVKGILSLNKIYDSNVIDKACKRALFYETLKYSVIKNICGNGAYNLPLDTNNINGGESYANN